jgi:hypothetical protein
MRMLALLLTVGGLAAAEPIHVFDFDEPDAMRGWEHKVNTTVSACTEDPFKGKAALRFTIDPAEFGFGWVNHALPDKDHSKLAGIHGAYRAPSGATGQLRMNIFIPSVGGEPSYFGADAGPLNESDGRWIEFFASLRDLRHERGPVRSLRPSELKPVDRIQFIASVGTQSPVSIDVDQIEFLNADDAAPIAARCAEAARARLLLPEGEIAGPPHPRLFFTVDRLPLYRAKAKAGGERQAAYERLLALAEELLKTYDAADPLAPVCEFVKTTTLEGRPWKGTFEGRIVPASFPIEILGAAYRLTGDKRFGAHGALALFNAAKRLTTDEPFLDRGFYYTRTFYVRALGFGYDWLWDVLTPEQRVVVKTTLLGFVRDIHDRSLTDGWGRWPLNRVWNWDPGLMGACGIGMLALEGETRMPEKAILFDCRRHMHDYLTLGIDADGCGHEGPNYLGYGIGAGVEFVEALRRQGRGDLFCNSNYHIIAPWLISETLPDGERWNNLSDCGHGQRPWPVYLYACSRLAELARSEPPVKGERWSSPELQAPLDYLQQFSEEPGPKRLSYSALAGLMGFAWAQGPGRKDPSKFDARIALAHVLFYEPCKPLADPAKLLPLGLHFRGRGLVVSRTGFGPDSLHLAVEAGPHAAGHDQSDKGTFTLYAYGGDLAVDSGYGNDSEPKKSGSSYAHNVVLIDGEGQPMRGHNQSSGHVTGFKHSPLLDWIRVDASEAWNVRYETEWWPARMPPVARAERVFVLVRPAKDVPPYLVVYDDIQKDAGPHDYTWLWHIPATMKFALSEGLWMATPRSSEHEVLTSPPTGPAGSAIFRFKVPKAGRYVIYGLVRAGGPELGKSDSFFAGVDSGARLTWDLRSGARLSWDAVHDRADTGPRVFDLAAGEHTLQLEVRERQAELARLLVAPAPPPTVSAAPAEPALPPDPDFTPEGAIALSIKDAAMEKPSLKLQHIRESAPADASLDVFPVNPPGGEAKTDWFLTSQEGLHPRLLYTARAIEPRFLMVLVPRRAGVPRPTVTALSNAGGVGAAVQWPGATDRVMFVREKSSPFRTSAGFIRTKGGKVTAWAILDGTRLCYDGQEIHHSDQPVVKISGAE